MTRSTPEPHDEHDRRRPADRDGGATGQAPDLPQPDDDAERGVAGDEPVEPPD